MVTPEEPGAVVAGSPATENGVPAPCDPCVEAPQGTDATAAVVEEGEKEEGGGGGKGGGGTAATATTVEAVGIDPSEHRMEGQNDLGNDAGSGLGNGIRKDVGRDAGNDVGGNIENGAGNGARNDSGNGVGHDEKKASQGVGTSETLAPAGRPARRLSDSSIAASAAKPEAPATPAAVGAQGATPGAGATRKGKWALKYKMKCRFCGGKLCLRCSEQCALRCNGAAIKGLHSHWITDSIIAMQRPSSSLIKKYDIVDQFKRKGVTAIFNLTEAGEHPYCGDNLEESSGFPYLPDTFMREGISFYNFAWEDMTTPSVSLLTDIVRVAVSVLRRGGKIAVHCHAGYGRTGLVIASIVVMTKNLTGQQAVELVRKKRPQSVQTPAQVAIVEEFFDYIRGVRVVYHFTDHARVTLGQHLNQQAFLLHGEESADLRWLPKPVALATRMLLLLAREKPQDVVLALVGVSVENVGDTRTKEALPTWGMAHEKQLKAMMYACNANNWDSWENLENQCDSEPAMVDARIPAQLLYDWLAQLAVPAISIKEVRTVLPQCEMSKALPDDRKKGATLDDNIASSQGGKGEFHLLNLLPVGQVRLLQCLTGCLRGVGDALDSAARTSAGEAFKKASLHMAISLLHLNDVHEGIMVGRGIAADINQTAEELTPTPPSTPTPTPMPSERKRYGSAQGGSGIAGAGAGGGLGQEGSSLLMDLRLCSKAMEVLLSDWKAPLRCRPYTKLEGIDNRPEVHKGDEDYWRSKRRSVVAPQDLMQTWKDTGGRSSDQATATRVPLAGRPSLTPISTVSTASIPSSKSKEAFDSWGTKDDAGTLTTSADTAARRPSLRRRSLSSGNIEGLAHLAPLDVGALVCEQPSPTAAKV